MEREIVIKIHEKDYQSLKNGHIPFSVLDVLMKGIPLPKGHGRLIDADAIQKYQIDTYGQGLSIIDNAPTIIEADKESEK
jgi:hypothetical protein